jgi:hypothetical protein
MSDALVTGPVVGGAHGWAFGAAGGDLAALGYVEDEWFVEGDATTYDFAPGAEATVDGAWSTVAVGSVPYRTRFLARRPVDPGRANGTVIVYWNNVTAGMDIILTEQRELFDAGYTVLAVSAQAVSVHGFTSAPMGLRAWDEERYGSLSVPTDDASYGILAEVGHLVRSGALAEGALRGIDVKHVIAVGGSQSAARLHSFVNGVAPIDPVFEAFVLHTHFGTGTPLNMGGAGPMPSMMGLAAPPYDLRAHPTRLRTDLGVRLFVVNSETETVSCGPLRQPDDDGYRFWETAGTCHEGGAMEPVQAQFQRDIGVDVRALAGMAGEDAPPRNDVDTSPVTNAAVRHMQRWITDGTPPPSLPRVELDDAGAICRDGHGIALGGIRLPDVAVPLATLTSDSGIPGLGSLSGARYDFDAATLGELYASRDAYLAEYDAAIEDGVRAGFVLDEDAAGLRQTARERPLPLPLS